jgi:MFS family permease
VSRWPVSLFGALAFGSISFWILWPLGVVLAKEDGWDATSTGLFAATTWAACLCLLPFAQALVIRIGHRNLVLLSKAILAVASLGYLLAFDGWLAWVWAALLGVSFGIRWPVLDAWAVELTPPSSRGRLLAVLETIAGAAMVAGPAMSAIGGLNQSETVITAALGAVLVAVMFVFLTELPPVQSAMTRDRREASTLQSRAFAGTVLAAALCGGLFECGFMAAGPLIAIAQGLPAETGLWVAATVGVGSVAVQLLLGWAADRFGAMRVLIFSAAGLGVAFAALVTLPTALTTISVAIGGLGGGLYTLATILGVKANVGTSAGAIGTAATVYTIGSLASPGFVGVVIDSWGWEIAVVGMAAASAVLWATLLRFSGATGRL